MYDSEMLVSVITPSYNSIKTVEACLISIKNQTYNNYEVIIVDDFSSDNSADYIESILPDDRFKLKCRCRRS